MKCESCGKGNIEGDTCEYCGYKLKTEMETKDNSENMAKYNRSIKKILLFRRTVKIVILGVVLLIVMINNKKAENIKKNTNKVIEETNSNNTSTDLELDSKEDIVYETSEEYNEAAEKFKQECVEIGYQELVYNYREYLGKNIKVSIKVAQILIDESTGNKITYYRGLQYKTIEHVQYNQYIIMDSREYNKEILDNDMITVYGTLQGLNIAERMIGGTVILPNIKMVYSEELNEEVFNNYNEERKYEDTKNYLEVTSEPEFIKEGYNNYCNITIKNISESILDGKIRVKLYDSNGIQFTELMGMLEDLGSGEVLESKLGIQPEVDISKYSYYKILLDN